MEENLYSNCIRTYTGKYLDVFNPDPEMICIEDIAHALSHTARFSGHLTKFYSVAAHSVWCAKFVKRDEFKLAALLHDASEAYLTDVPRPIKKQLPQYKVIEDNLMRVIADKFGFEYPLHPFVKEIDNMALQWEWDNLMIAGLNGSLSFEYDEKEFLQLFESWI